MMPKFFFIDNLLLENDLHIYKNQANLFSMAWSNEAISSMIDYPAIGGIGCNVIGHSIYDHIITLN